MKMPPKELMYGSEKEYEKAMSRQLKKKRIRQCYGQYVVHVKHTDERIKVGV